MPSPYPLRDLFDAAVRKRTVRLTCRRCRHVNSFPSAALWWLFQRRGWDDRFAAVCQRCICRHCLLRGDRIGNPRMTLTWETPLDQSLPMPSERDWKRERSRRR